MTKNGFFTFPLPLIRTQLIPIPPRMFFSIPIQISMIGLIGRWKASLTVSYTHLTLPTNREV